MELDVFQASRRSRRMVMAALAGLWLMPRLPLWLGSQGSAFDMGSYAKVVESLSSGHGLYGNPELAGRYPYLPAWGLICWALGSLASLLNLNAVLFFKLPALLADLGLTLLLFRILERLVLPGQALSAAGEPAWMARPFWGAAAFALSPLSLMIGAAHGQFDSVALFFVLGAAWYVEFSDAPRSDLAAALCLGFAITLKTWPIYFLPLFVKGLPRANERWRFVLLSLALPLLLLLPFLIDAGVGPVAHALSYAGATALSLPESLRSFFYGSGASAESYKAVAEAWKLAGLGSLAALWLLYWAGPWRFPLLVGLATAVLTLYVFAPGLSVQYLVWLLPFALCLPGRLALRFSAIALLPLLVFYLCFAPEALFPASAYGPPALPAWAFLVWGLLNLGFWLYLVAEWLRILQLARRPSGRLGFV